MNDYRILVVDDEEDLCEILKFNLENEGYEVDTANSAEEAMKMDISSYHLILLDVMMGEIYRIQNGEHPEKDRKQLKCLLSLSQQKIPKRYCDGLQPGSRRLYFKTFSLREVIARVKAVLRRTVTTETERVPRTSYLSVARY